ncbi:MAG: hypothetical protein ACI4MH_07655 [Candidatus Coproplasma sp.]
MIFVKKFLFTTALACLIAASATYSTAIATFADDEESSGGSQSEYTQGEPSSGGSTDGSQGEPSSGGSTDGSQGEPSSGGSSDGSQSGKPQTVYPTEFLCEPTFSSVSDYAIFGDGVAVADGTRLYLIESDGSSDSKMTVFDCGFEITNLDYAQDKLYIGDVEGKTYVYPDNTTPIDYAFADELTTLTVGQYTYLLATDGLRCFSSGNLENMGTGFTCLKQYDGSAYVLKENAIYKLDGATANKVSLEYTDFSAASDVSTGDVKDVLLSDYSVKTVTVNPTTADGGETYCTEVNLTDLSGDKFTVGKTVKINGVRSALAIAETGNATIIVMNDGSESKSYITLTSALDQTAYTAPVTDMTNAYALSTIKAYSRPYICGATELETVAQGTVMTIIEKFSLNFIDTVFYKVSYETEGREVIGYVVANYLSPYTFSAEQNQPESIKDEFSYDNDMQTVIIVLLIIALVIIAIAYLTVVGTREKGKKKRKRSSQRKAAPPDDTEYYGN